MPHTLKVSEALGRLGSAPVHKVNLGGGQEQRVPDAAGQGSPGCSSVSCCLNDQVVHVVAAMHRQHERGARDQIQVMPEVSLHLPHVAQRPWAPLAHARIPSALEHVECGSSDQIKRRDLHGRESTSEQDTNKAMAAGDIKDMVHSFLT
eukprot:754949-Hanusia_phi.AAC.3